MTFTTLTFYLFLPVVYLAFSFSPERWRSRILLAASYGFYASFQAPYLLCVLLAVTITGYWCGLQIGAAQHDDTRKRWLRVGIAACLAPLIILKYLPFFSVQIGEHFGADSNDLSVITIVGVSYFTLQAISYLADIYLQLEEPEKDFGCFALYLAFFPKLLQGPIERAGDLLPQLKMAHRFEYEATRSGIILFTWGLFKKLVIADRLALYADQVFNQPHEYAGLPLIIGCYAYAFQIFFDFSAYTDMARGVARLFGIELTENFNNPYGATSIAEFWRRWHISFSRWILDYIFRPLQMTWRQHRNLGVAAALMTTFLVSGIWHGASWGFVVWGALHGIYMSVAVFYQPYKKKLHKRFGMPQGRLLKIGQIFLTFNLVCFAWLFFRAADLDDAVYIVSNLLKFHKGEQFSLMVSQGYDELTILILSLLSFAATGLLSGKQNVMSLVQRYFPLRHALYCLLVITIILFGTYSIDAQFLYFKF